MTKTAATDLVHKIGDKILSDPAYVNQPWEGLAFVGTFSKGQRRMNGYRYTSDGAFHASLPDDDDYEIMNGLADLQKEMAGETGTEWHQCLIHLWKPGPKIHIDFEYENPERWKPKVKSLDMSDYANAIRPPIG